MLTDTHCHILSTCYYNPENILRTLEENNIKRIIINGYNLKTNKEIINLIEKYNNVFGALGIHPDNLNENIEETIDLIKDNNNNSKIIAIGEIGLDYYHNKENKEAQKELFEKFLSLAEKQSLPVIIHNREATNDILKCLKKYKVKGIIHCFSGSLETAKEFIKLGFKLGINGVVTFKNSNLQETLKNISLNNILIETDSPYLSPVPFRGLPNEPANLNIIIKKLSEIYKKDINEISAQLESNFLEVFDIRK